MAKTPYNKLMTRLHHLFLAIRLLPLLITDKAARRLLAQMRSFCRTLPAQLQRPLPQAMAQLAPASGEDPLPSDSEARVRELADLAALLAIRSPLGLCLRRSLTRYHFLRRAGVPVAVQFGARFQGDKADRDVTGHAWLTLNGRPYYEAEENWRNFTVMFRWPPAADTPPAAAPQSRSASSEPRRAE